MAPDYSDYYKKEAQKKSPESQDGYTVGYSNGMTVLRLHADYSSMTLSMSEEEVYRLIRLLEASLDNQDD